MSEGFIPLGVVGSTSQTLFYGTSNAGTWGGGTGLSGTEPVNYTPARHITLTCHTCGNLLPLTHTELPLMWTDTWSWLKKTGAADSHSLIYMV